MSRAPRSRSAEDRVHSVEQGARRATGGWGTRRWQWALPCGWEEGGGGGRRSEVSTAVGYCPVKEH